MEATDNFKKTIEAHLKQASSNDLKLAGKMANPKKSIDNCINYIFKTVQASGKHGFTDDEVFGMALHYYDEDDLTTVEASRVKVVVNHTVDLTEAEKEQARQMALEKAIEEEKARMKKKTAPKKVEDVSQASLF